MLATTVINLKNTSTDSRYLMFNNVFNDPLTNVYDLSVQSVYYSNTHNRFFKDERNDTITLRLALSVVFKDIGNIPGQWADVLTDIRLLDNEKIDHSLVFLSFMTIDTGSYTPNELVDQLNNSASDYSPMRLEYVDGKKVFSEIFAINHGDGIQFALVDSKIKILLNYQAGSDIKWKITYDGTTYTPFFTLNNYYVSQNVDPDKHVLMELSVIAEPHENLPKILGFKPLSLSDLLVHLDQKVRELIQGNFIDNYGNKSVYKLDIKFATSNGNVLTAPNYNMILSQDQRLNIHSNTLAAALTEMPSCNTENVKNIIHSIHNDVPFGAPVIMNSKTPIRYRFKDNYTLQDIDIYLSTEALEKLPSIANCKIHIDLVIRSFI